MKVLLLISILPMMAACMLMRPIPGEYSRPLNDNASDLENLEMLLLDEQPFMHQSTREPTDNGSLRLGMEKNRVQRQLGRPSAVEVAGNPDYGNERWIYENTVPTLNGYYKEKRVIYFEGGNVVGWESQ